MSNCLDFVSGKDAITMVAPKQEAIRLRVEERLAFGEILEATGASRSSLSVWLKPYPLTEEERQTRQKKVKRYVTPKKDRGQMSKFFQAVAGQELSRHRKGKIAEAAVLLRLALQDFTVYAPPFDGDKADCVVQVPETGRIHKIQVR